MLPFAKQDYSMISGNYISHPGFYTQMVAAPFLQQIEKMQSGPGTMNSNKIINGTFNNNESEECIAHQKEINRLNSQNAQLLTQVKELVSEKETLIEKINNLEALLKMDSDQGKNELKKKRSRRVANEIERLFSCPLDTCKKSYGSEGSLMQHIKLKHPEYFLSINETTQNYNKIIVDGNAAKTAYENLKKKGQKE